MASTGWGGRRIVSTGVRASPMPPPTAFRRKPVTRAAAHAMPTRSGPVSMRPMSVSPRVARPPAAAVEEPSRPVLQ